MRNPNLDENEVLRDALSGLNEEVPAMPEELHAAWMQKVEDDMENNRIEKNRNRRSFIRFLGVAAAMVFIVGGTLLTRDSLENGARNAGQTAYMAESCDDGTLAMGSSKYAADFCAPGAAMYDATAEEDSITPMVARTMNATEDSVEELADAAGSRKKIIRTANLTILTQTYDASLRSLKGLCEANGGWIESSSETLNSATGLRRATLTLRIPQDALDGYLTGTEQLGRITSRSESARDVTASYQDTQTRLETQLALMARLQALITESADLSDLLALESQIADTQYTIDTLQSSLNSTDRQVTYSTVYVSLREETAPALTDTTVSLGERIAAALRTGCEAVVSFAQDALVFLVAALPFIGIAAVIGLIVFINRKIRRRKHS